MKINRILDYYYRARNYRPGSGPAPGEKLGRAAIEAFKTTVGLKHIPAPFKNLKKMMLTFAYGPLYWPNTSWEAVDEVTAGLLYSLVRLTRPDVAVEIGTGHGNSAIAIAQALEENRVGKLYTIDPVERELVRIAMKKSRLEHRMTYIVDYSTIAIPRLNLPRIDFVFIDGDHSYEAVSADFTLVRDLIPRNGIIVFHDALGMYVGPKKVIEELKTTNNFEIVTLPTLSGHVRNRRAILSTNHPDSFLVDGVSICRRL